MEGASEAEAPPVAVVAPLSKSADTVEHGSAPAVPHSETEAAVFFSGNPEIDIIKGAQNMVLLVPRKRFANMLFLFAGERLLVFQSGRMSDRHPGVLRLFKDNK